MARDRMPTAVLFDAGGTLIVQDPDELGERLGRPVDETVAHRAHYLAMAEYSELLTEGRDLGWEWWLERYLDLLGVPEPHLARRTIDGGRGTWNRRLEGVGDAIEGLREEGVRVAVVSNSDGSVAESLEKAGLAGLFEFVIDSHHVGVSKPDPRIFDMALDRLGVEASETWFVGDSVYHDIQGALGVSMARAILVDPYDLGPTGVETVESVAGMAP